MGIFHKRPFMLCLCCFLAAAFLYDIPGGGKLIIAAAALLVAVSFFIISKILKSKAAKLRFAVAAGALVFTALSLFESFVYFNLYVADFEQYTDTDCIIECEVTDEKQGNGADLAHVNLISVNGERKSGKAIIYFEYGENLGNKTIKLNVKGITLDSLEYYGGRDNLMADGVSSAFSVEDHDAADIQVVGEKNNIFVVLNDFTHNLSLKLANDVGGEVGKFSSAILLGRRDLISEATSRDFARSGISHILALSGLHIALIAGLIEFVLRKFYVPKIVRCFVIIPFLALYVAITGFGMSTIRAAVMLTIFYLCFIFSRPRDSLTTVALAGFLIVFLMPFSIMSCGFIMSLAATFGIIVISPYLSGLLKNRRSDTKIKTVSKIIGRFVISSLLITLAANVAVIYYTWSMFGQISLATPLANLIITPVVAVQLYAAALYLLLGWIPFVRTALIAVQKFVGGYILQTAGALSDVKGVCVSMNYDFVGVIVIALLVSTAVLLIVKLRHKWLIAAPVTVSAIAFCVCLAVTFSVGKNSVTAEYIAYNEREMLVLTQNGETVICDIGDGNYSAVYNAYKTARENGATEIEVLLMTHYHAKHAVSVERICRSQKVRNIWLPEPENEDQYYILKSIAETADKNGVDLVIYKEDEDLTVFYDGKLKIYPHETLKRSTQPVLSFEFTFGNDKFFYVGSSAPETQLYEKLNENLPDADFVVFGTHGPNPKETYPIDAAKNAKTVVFANRELLELARIANEPEFYAEIICDCTDFRFKMSK